MIIYYQKLTGREKGLLVGSFFCKKDKTATVEGRFCTRILTPPPLTVRRRCRRSDMYTDSTVLSSSPSLHWKTTFQTDEQNYKEKNSLSAGCLFGLATWERESSACRSVLVICTWNSNSNGIKCWVGGKCCFSRRAHFILTNNNQKKNSVYGLDFFCFCSLQAIVIIAPKLKEVIKNPSLRIHLIGFWLLAENDVNSSF
jgi:hypothetical protein